jgi:hypothetical protein
MEKSTQSEMLVACWVKLLFKAASCIQHASLAQCACRARYGRRCPSLLTGLSPAWMRNPTGLKLPPYAPGSFCNTNARTANPSISSRSCAGLNARSYLPSWMLSAREKPFKCLPIGTPNEKRTASTNFLTFCTGVCVVSCGLLMATTTPTEAHQRRGGGDNARDESAVAAPTGGASTSGKGKKNAKGVSVWPRCGLR